MCLRSSLARAVFERRGGAPAGCGAGATVGAFVRAKMDQVLDKTARFAAPAFLRRCTTCSAGLLSYELV